jgi:hypothetical protein
MSGKKYEVSVRVKRVEADKYVALFEDGVILSERIVLLAEAERGRSFCFNMEFNGIVWSARGRSYALLKKVGMSDTFFFTKTRKKKLPVKLVEEVEGTPLF